MTENRRLNRVASYIAAIFSWVCATTALAQAPQFSWDTVPVYLHFGSHKAMSDEQVAITARLSNFICLEKAHGRLSDRKHPERIAASDAQRIKALNPDAKVLMYWNTLIAWPFTSYNFDFAQTHPDDWTLRDMKTGDPLLKVESKNMKVYQYNLLNPDMRKWWAETIGGAVKEYGFDGFFMDAVSQAKRPLWLRKGFGLDKAEELDAAANDMMKHAKSIMGEERLLIYNGFRSKSGGPDGAVAVGTEFLSFTDGAQIEHFDQFTSTTKEDVIAYWKMAAEAASAGKIVLYKAWPDHDINWLNKQFMSKTQAEKESLARKRITYPLACYLIGAQENSYFCYGWGYDVDDGQLIEYPQYRKKLGSPKGDFQREGWIFRRSFKHADVTLDLENRTAKIQWREE